MTIDRETLLNDINGLDRRYSSRSIEHWNDARRFSSEIYSDYRDELGQELFVQLCNRLSSQPAGSCVLDIGTGAGVALAEIQVRYPQLIMLGTNIVPDWRVNINLKPSRVTITDAENLYGIKDSSVDTIIAIRSLGYVSDPKKAILSMTRVLKPDGYIFASCASFCHYVCGDLVRDTSEDHEASIFMDSLRQTNLYTRISGFPSVTPTKSGSLFLAVKSN